MSVQRAVSVFDLAKVPGAVKIIQGGDTEEINNLLWQYGFDIFAGYEFEECFHRPLTNKDNTPVFGVRVSGVERLDDEWIGGGNATWEAKVAAIKDSGLRAELMSMGREGASDRTWADDNVARKVIQKEKNKGI